MTDPGPIKQVLDVRQMPKPDQHPAIFASFDALSRDEALMPINDIDARPLAGSAAPAVTP